MHAIDLAEHEQEWSVSKQVEDDTSIFLVRQALVHLTNTPSLLFLNLALSYS
jgi:hypothetical protein